MKKQATNSNFTLEINEKKIEVSLKGLAQQADGSALIKMGETMVLATAVMKKEAQPGMNYFPLMVDYEENYWAAGKIKGSRFVKRKGRPSDDAVLSGRLIDRSLRPLFPKGMRNEVQVIINVLSFDAVNDPRPLAILAASIALEISEIPFNGPLSAVLIGEKNDKLLLFPTIKEQADSKLNIFISGVKENITMVEAGANEASEEMILKAMLKAQTENTKIAKFINQIKKGAGKPKTEVELFIAPDELKKALKKEVKEKFETIFENYNSKKDYEAKVGNLIKKIVEAKTKKNEANDQPDESSLIKEALEEIHKEIIRSKILKEKKRLGKRGMEEVRPISATVSFLPRTHGSALFNRGETQGLTTATLGSPGSELILETMSTELGTKQRYMHYYDFPPFSCGDTKPMRGPGRREIGHGALGEKALIPMIPSKEDFPYTIMMQTEILASDGSTSMASVCGSTLALMDAGVPIKKPVSGVAMGLIIDAETKKYQILTDLCANEDFAGHMDFKVAGTQDGVTALQMDIKVKGLSIEILKDALNKARAGRLHILEKMLKAIAEPRKVMSKYAPRIEKIKIDPDKIGTIIGPGGKVINGIIEETGVQIDIEDSGLVFITGDDQESMEKATEKIKAIIKVPKVGEIYVGKVTRIKDFGAMVEFLPGQEGLIHISRLVKGQRVNRVTDIVNIGEKVKIKIDEKDHLGRYNLSLIEKIK